MRKVGIIGGMGPEATSMLFQRVIARTPADDDADHIPMLIDNDPRIPSRIRFLLEENGTDPTAYLCAIAQGLEQAGCEAIAMPCNTAHHFAGAISNSVSVPFINMIERTVKRLVKDNTKRVGMFCSPALRKMEIFTPYFNDAGLEAIFPRNDNEPLQLIRDIKASLTPNQTLMRKILHEIERAGAGTLLLSCSELSLYKDTLPTTLPILDTIDVLADEILAFATHSA